MMGSIDEHAIEILISLGIVAGTYAVAQRLHLSGPIAVVITGLLIGNRGAEFSMSDHTRTYLFGRLSSDAVFGNVQKLHQRRDTRVDMGRRARRYIRGAGAIASACGIQACHPRGNLRRGGLLDHRARPHGKAGRRVAGRSWFAVTQLSRAYRLLAYSSCRQSRRGCLRR